VDKKAAEAAGVQLVVPGRGLALLHFSPQHIIRCFFVGYGGLFERFSDKNGSG
jgi:hypothetical protein